MLTRFEPNSIPAICVAAQGSRENDSRANPKIAGKIAQSEVGHNGLSISLFVLQHLERAILELQCVRLLPKVKGSAMPVAQVFCQHCGACRLAAAGPGRMFLFGLRKRSQSEVTSSDVVLQV